MSQSWTCLKNQKFTDSCYSIIPIRKEHIEHIRIWRNRQIDILRQDTEISREDQETYFDKNIWPTITN